MKEGENKLNDDREDKAFINYGELLELRNKLYNEWANREDKAFINYEELLELINKLYNEWAEEYIDAPFTKYKNPLLRIKNITSLLVGFYTLFPPLRLEAMNLKIVDNEQEAEENEYSIILKTKIIFGFI